MKAHALFAFATLSLAACDPTAGDCKALLAEQKRTLSLPDAAADASYAGAAHREAEALRAISLHDKTLLNLRDEYAQALDDGASAIDKARAAPLSGVEARLKLEIAAGDVQTKLVPPALALTSYCVDGPH